MHGYAITANGNVYEPITDRIYTPENAQELFHQRDIAVYSGDEAMVQMVKTGHWGPWDDESNAWYEEKGL